MDGDDSMRWVSQHTKKASSLTSPPSIVKMRRMLACRRGLPPSLSGSAGLTPPLPSLPNAHLLVLHPLPLGLLPQAELRHRQWRAAAAKPAPAVPAQIFSSLHGCYSQQRPPQAGDPVAASKAPHPAATPNSRNPLPWLPAPAVAISRAPPWT
jgi:hypothetical protein